MVVRHYGIAPPGTVPAPESVRHTLLFTTRVGIPIPRNKFRTQVWLPAVKASGVDFRVRGIGERLMNPHALSERCRPMDRRAHERVPELPGVRPVIAVVTAGPVRCGPRAGRGTRGST